MHEKLIIIDLFIVDIGASFFSAVQSMGAQENDTQPEICTEIT